MGRGALIFQVQNPNVCNALRLRCHLTRVPILAVESIPKLAIATNISCVGMLSLEIEDESLRRVCVHRCLSRIETPPISIETRTLLFVRFPVSGHLNFLNVVINQDNRVVMRRESPQSNGGNSTHQFESYVRRQGIMSGEEVKV